MTVIQIATRQLAIYFGTAWPVSIAKMTPIRNRIPQTYIRWRARLFGIVTHKWKARAPTARHLARGNGSTELGRLAFPGSG
ncbi:hypothetical protein [Nocardia xishanensis]